MALPVRLGVIGWPIDHSHSPAMHNAALRVLHLPWEYAAFAVAPADGQKEGRLREAILCARALGLLGLNVTLPYKQAVLSLCQPDALALRVQAVNTLRFPPADDPGTAVLGTNTDVPGFAALCRESGAAPLPGTTAVILGAGGAARAVLVALLDAGARVTVARRTPGSIHVDARPVATVPLHRCHVTPLLAGCDLLVDCTPRGLQPTPYAALDRTHPELDLRALPPHATILDLCVRPTTSLTAAAAALGLRAATGEAMLLHQGARSLSFWLDAPLPGPAFDAMRKALAASLAQG